MPFGDIFINFLREMKKKTTTTKKQLIFLTIFYIFYANGIKNFL